MFHHGVSIIVSNKQLKINEMKRGHILETEGVYHYEFPGGRDLRKR